MRKSMKKIGVLVLAISMLLSVVPVFAADTTVTFEVKDENGDDVSTTATITVTKDDDGSAVAVSSGSYTLADGETYTYSVALSGHATETGTLTGGTDNGDITVTLSPGASGAGTYEGYLQKKVLSVTLPTASATTFAYTMDPGKLISETEGEAFKSADTEPLFPTSGDKYVYFQIANHTNQYEEVTGISNDDTFAAKQTAANGGKLYKITGFTIVAYNAAFDPNETYYTVSYTKDTTVTNASTFDSAKTAAPFGKLFVKIGDVYTEIDAYDPLDTALEYYKAESATDTTKFAEASGLLDFVPGQTYFTATYAEADAYAASTTYYELKTKAGNTYSNTSDPLKVVNQSSGAIKLTVTAEAVATAGGKDIALVGSEAEFATATNPVLYLGLNVPEAMEKVYQKLSAKPADSTVSDDDFAALAATVTEPAYKDLKDEIKALYELQYSKVNDQPEGVDDADWAALTNETLGETAYKALDKTKKEDICYEPSMQVDAKIGLKSGSKVSKTVTLAGHDELFHSVYNSSYTVGGTAPKYKYEKLTLAEWQDLEINSAKPNAHKPQVMYDAVWTTLKFNLEGAVKTDATLTSALTAPTLKVTWSWEDANPDEPTYTDGGDAVGQWYNGLYYIGKSLSDPFDNNDLIVEYSTDGTNYTAYATDKYVMDGNWVTFTWDNLSNGTGYQDGHTFYVRVKDKTSLTQYYHWF